MFYLSFLTLTSDDLKSAYAEGCVFAGVKFSLPWC